MQGPTTRPSHLAMVRVFPWLLTALAGIAAAPGAHAGTITYSTIALTGQVAPGFPAGTVFNSVADPRLDEHGHWMFWARLSGGPVTLTDDTTFWSNRSGVLSLVIREGAAAPGSTDLILSLATPTFGDSGYFAFSGALGSGAITQPTNIGILAEDSAGIGIFARESPALPTLGLAAFNDAGALVFRDGAGTTIWTTRTGTALPIVSTGNPVPGTGLPDAAFLLLGAPSHNAAGDAAFRSSFTYTGQSAPAHGIWAETARTLHTVAYTGEAVPGIDPEANFTDFDSTPRLTSSGVTVFWAAFAGGSVTPANDAAIFATSGAAVAILVREGQPAPGLAGLTIDSLARTLAVADNGVACFTATLAGPGVTAQNNTAVYTVDASTSPAGAPRLVIREGDEVFGLPAGIRVAAVDRPAISASGRVVLGAHLRGTDVTQNSAYALFAADGTGLLHTLARVGDTIPLPPPATGQRTIAQIIQDHGPSQSGTQAYSAQGVLAYKLVFTDNTSGLFTASIPACPADFNGDSFLDGIDYDLFVNAFESGTPEADFNNDTFIDGIDYDQFAAAFDRGC